MVTEYIVLFLVVLINSKIQSLPDEFIFIKKKIVLFIETRHTFFLSEVLYLMDDK